MSLELAAQHLASRGRKGDSMLVHMAPQEVSGLQALAKAAGGSLTLNPDTGLPEANFLKRMLPMIIGAGITAATGGAAAPWMIGLGLGGAETLRTGSLEKGLMAGLGAYGGAGIGAGLLGAGTAGTAGASTSALDVLGQPMTGTAQAAGQGFGANLSQMGQGVSALGTEAGRSAAMSSMGGGMGAAKYGLAAAMPVLQGEPPAPYAGSGPNPYEYSYDPNNQQYTRVPPGTRQRDILAPTTQMMAAGGPVDEMSQRNQMETMMANGGQMFAAGGQINLQGTINMGDGGGGQPGPASANGYQPAGGTPLQGFSSSFGQMGGGRMSGGRMSGGQMGGFDLRQLQADGYDPRAVQANPQGFRQQLVAEQQRRAQANAVGHLPKRPQQQMPSVGKAAIPDQGAIGIGDFMQTQFPPQSMAHVMPQEYGSFSKLKLPTSPGGQMMGDMRDRPERDDAIIAANQAISNFEYYAQGGMASMARGGPSHLGDYSDGGRLLKGPGDGVSDSIPATIANKRPARLADGEFVVPARIVSELGNGSTEAGARKLYAMMDRVQKARGRTTGKDRVAVNSRAEKLLPA
jgi:hypothetical protein